MFYEKKERNIQISISTNFPFESHLHHEIELRICTEGVLNVSCNGIYRTLHKGDIMVAFPNDIHEYFESEKGSGYMLIFNPGISDIITNLISGRGYENFVSMTELIPLFRELHSEFNNDCSIPVMYGYIHTIMGKIFKKLTPCRILPAEENDLLTSSLRYISDNYTKPLTLKSLAKEMGVSHNHLSRVFSEKIPGGFCSYLQSLRIVHACELLKNTNLNIYEVLLASGYTNQRTFYRAFKAETGTSPKEYKKQR